MGCTVDITLRSDEREGTQSYVLRWLKSPGETVVIHEPLLEISTDKVTVEVAAPASGVLLAILKAENAQVLAGEVLGQIEAALTAEEGSASASCALPQSQGAQGSSQNLTEQDSAASGAHHADLSPAVRKMISEHKIDPACIRGTGSGGRITHQDILAYLAQRKEASGTGNGAPSSDDAIGGRMIPHSPMRRSIAHHMVQSMLHTAPHVTTVFEADLSQVLADREARRHEHEARGVRLTLTAYFVRAMVAALRVVPEVNSRWHDDALEVFGQANIGIATALPQGGLVVPVIRDAQSLSLDQVAQQITTLTERARSGTLSAADVQGGTCTITNHGVSGSLIATPIINQPQSAILGIGAVQKRVTVVVEDGEEVARIRPMAFVTLTIDHRVLDGFQANTFLGAFIEGLRNLPNDGR